MSATNHILISFFQLMNSFKVSWASQTVDDLKKTFSIVSVVHLIIFIQLVAHSLRILLTDTCKIYSWVPNHLLYQRDIDAAERLALVHQVYSSFCIWVISTPNATHCNFSALLHECFIMIKNIKQESRRRGLNTLIYYSLKIDKMWLILNDVCGLVCVVFTYLVVIVVYLGFIRIGIWEQIQAGDIKALIHFSIF